MSEEIIDVATAVTYNAENDRFLLMKRAETMEYFPGHWDFPSGRIGDETPENAALRELKEEAGLVGQVIRSGEPFTVESGHGEIRVHPFLVMVEDTGVEMNTEHTEYEWVKPGELEKFETVEGLKEDLERVGVLDD